jgi:hypothetical protein
MESCAGSSLGLTGHTSIRNPWTAGVVIKEVAEESHCQGSVKQDILEPAPKRVLHSDSPAGDTSKEILELGCCQVNSKCLELLWSNWFEYSQVRNKPQSLRQYLPQGQEGMLDHMLHLYIRTQTLFLQLWYHRLCSWIRNLRLWRIPVVRIVVTIWWLLLVASFS